MLNVLSVEPSERAEQGELKPGGGTTAWSEGLAVCCGYPTEIIAEHAGRSLRFLAAPSKAGGSAGDGLAVEPLRCRSLASGRSSERTVVVYAPIRVERS